MKKLFLYFFLISCLYISCDSYSKDKLDSFPSADYSTLIKNDKYEITETSSPLQVFNLFYNEFGYGEHVVTGSATHAEMLIPVDSEQYKKPVTDIKLIKIINIQDPKAHTSSFSISFINTNEEVLSYCYKWQYHTTNIWENSKKSTWCQTENWFKKSDEKTRLKWRISINRG